eukprot:EC096601.1.p1 GENE.EC096601.1~~EC096601.1.p1  ORF type:complete len:160 (-),score=4.49 EC096601.1:169-648(-)
MLAFLQMRTIYTLSYKLKETGRKYLQRVCKYLRKYYNILQIQQPLGRQINLLVIYLSQNMFKQIEEKTAFKLFHNFKNIIKQVYEICCNQFDFKQNFFIIYRGKNLKTVADGLIHVSMCFKIYFKQKYTTTEKCLVRQTFSLLNIYIGSLFKLQFLQIN